MPFFSPCSYKRCASFLDLQLVIGILCTEMPGVLVEDDRKIQYVDKDTPLEDILDLIKRDGAVFVRKLVPEEAVDKARTDIEDRLENDVDWEGDFFPSQTSTRAF